MGCCGDHCLMRRLGNHVRFEIADPPSWAAIQRGAAACCSELMRFMLAGPTDNTPLRRAETGGVKFGFARGVSDELSSGFCACAAVWRPVRDAEECRRPQAS